MGDPVILDALTWPAVRALVEGGETLCLLPVGATEQHGRHLPLNTDSEIAAAICLAASERTGVAATRRVTSSAKRPVWKIRGGGVGDPVAAGDRRAGREPAPAAGAASDSR